MTAEPTAKSALTFGVELEFIIQYADPAYASPYHSRNSGHHAVLERVANALRTVNLKVYPEVPTSKVPLDNYATWRVDTDYSINHIVKNSPPSEGPEITGVKCPHKEFCSVEITSPIFEVGQEGWELEIESAIAAVKNAFVGEVYINDSTGLHVHVANGRNGEFPLQTIKNLGSLVIIYEKFFNALHPPHRVGNSNCMPLTRANTDAVKMADKIKETATMKELVRMLNQRSSQRTVNFLNIVDQNSGINTVEFRQHHGTMRAEVVMHWARFVTALVNFAEALEEDGPFMAAVVQAEGIGPRDIIEFIVLHLRIPEVADFYSTRLWIHDYELLERTMAAQFDQLGSRSSMSGQDGDFDSVSTVNRMLELVDEIDSEELGETPESPIRDAVSSLNCIHCPSTGRIVTPQLDKSL